MILNNNKPRVINIDKNGADNSGIKTWNERNCFVKGIQVRQCKYPNNIVGQDHRSIERCIAISCGFKEFEPAKRTMSSMGNREHDKKGSNHGFKIDGVQNILLFGRLM